MSEKQGEIIVGRQIILETDFAGLKLARRGKVRDLYEVGEFLLIVATDRISAFDVVLPNGIPGKGIVLTQISRFWFEVMKDIVPGHVVSTDVSEYPEACQPHGEILEGRSMLVKKAQPLPVECVVRGYLSGSGWSEYQRSRSVCGIDLPPGLLESSRLEVPLLTPSTKAEQGEHDQNITFERMRELIGDDLAEEIRKISINVYNKAHALAEQKGVIIADTKFEFGLHDGELMLIDELLTPDSSRFWVKENYQAGRGQDSLDKQFVRDYLSSISWNRRLPAPSLPEEVVQQTAKRYQEVLYLLTGQRIDA